MSLPPAVLLVEDDPTNQLIALSMLRHLGIEADAASNGAVGVEMEASQAYDVILMDIQMPVMDGVEAMRAIRGRHPDGGPRIVAVTAHAVSGTRERMLQVGFDGFYNKPLSIALLEDAVGPSPEVALPPDPMIAPPLYSEASGSLLDDVRAHVRSLLGEDDEEFVAELTEAFAESARQALTSVAAAHAAGDVASVASAAHALKGSASNVGLTALAERWDAIETDARQGAVSSPDRLRDATEQTERTLDQFTA